MGGWDAGGPPVTSMGEGSYFSQDLGTMVRGRFNTRSYGQDEDQDGNLDIGTMQVVSWDDSIAFFDGQVTLSDVQGVGFNVGIGYRWLSYVPYATDAERVTGVSLWGDGTSTEADNFFPQLGVSYRIARRYLGLTGQRLHPDRAGQPGGRLRAHRRHRLPGAISSPRWPWRRSTNRFTWRKWR